MEMSKHVEIDVDKRTIIIYGKNKNDDAIVLYEDLKRDDHSDEFFKRWTETQSLIFEFQVHNLKNVAVFAIRGLWLDNKWFGIKVVPFSNTEIL
jgi:hypothetical protein